jgi:hypothetical protein
MVAVLEQAFEAIHQLSESEQERIGQWLLAELDAERAWEALLAQPKSQNLLAALAAEALADYDQLLAQL